MLTTVRQVLKTKGTDIYSVTPQTTILNALKLMADKDIGAVLVIEDDQVKGIFSERDYARRGYLEGKSCDALVNEVMSRPVYYIGADDTMETCMSQMTDKRIRHLPVVEKGEVIGVISIGDVVKTIITNQKSVIEGLENYILGTESQL